MQQSTLKKLSEVLGISISTVSRALKDHPDISQSTKTRVKDLAEAMKWFLAQKTACLLEVMVPYSEHVLPMIPAGATYKDLIYKDDAVRKTLVPGSGL